MLTSMTRPPPGVIVVVQLMALQSRFGTDERFRMDARFLEEEEETGEKGEAHSTVCFVSSSVRYKLGIFFSCHRNNSKTDT